MTIQVQLIRPALPAGSLSGSAPTEEEATTAQVQRIVRAVVQASLEVLGGSRPLQQMADWLGPSSYERLHLRANLTRSLNRGTSTTSHPDRLLHRNVTVLSVRTCRLSAQVYEASAVTCENNRARAVALRLEHRRGRWKVTALEIG